MDSYVVMGAGPGIGRAVVELLLDAGARVVAVDREAPTWDERLVSVAGDAGDEAVAARAADLAEDGARLAGWVNNAAVFRDASVHETPARDVAALISANLDPCLAGCTVAVRRFLAAGSGGAIVNVSSHQARRPVPGCVPYATAKAAIEGLTRALAVDYGPHRIRVNAVAPGTVATSRYHADLAALGDGGPRMARETARLHALERVSEPGEVAAAIGYLLFPAASAVTGVTLPVDGGRSVLAREP